MKIPPSINRFRAKAMRGLTGSIGQSQKPKAGEKLVLNCVLISRPNGRLGNLLLTTPLVQEIQNHFPDCKIDFFVKGGLTPIIYKNYNNIDRIFILPGKPFKELGKWFGVWFKLRKNKYDLAINVTQQSSSGRLSVALSRSKYRLFGEVDESTEIQEMHMAKKPVYVFRDFLESAGIKTNDPIPEMDLKLSAAELEHGKQKLHEFVTDDKPVISIFTFATGNKMYDNQWWQPFYMQLQQSYPNHNILEILPKENVSQINFAAPSYCGSDVREMGAIMANTELFIGADSGIMHLANASKVPTLGLFKVTNALRYTPYGNASTAIDTKETPMSQWLQTVNEILYRTRILVHSVPGALLLAEIF